MDGLFQEQLAAQARVELAERRPHHHGCRSPIRACPVPLTQITDPLNPVLEGRRRPATIEG
eukprot:3965432-Prymnesium_polylepis.1